MKLKEIAILDPQAKIYGARNIEIFGISSHSSKVGPGFLYIAKRGAKFDGNSFVPLAVANGAICVVTDLFDPSLTVPQIVVKDVVVFEAKLADAFYGSPSKKLQLVGVTGTSGKTTVTYLLRNMFEQFGISTGLVGTVSYIAGNFHTDASNTTPDVITNQNLLSEMVRSKMTACAMEVSSHALDQGRVLGLEFATAVFTNLTHEHLDYHETMDRYAAAKNILFRSLNEDSVAVANAEDPHLKAVIANTKARVVTFGFTPAADVMASQIVLGRKTSFLLSYQKESLFVEMPLIGRFNVSNALAAAAVFLAHGYSLRAVADALSNTAPPPGRLEKVPNSLGLSIYVDYAHKEDALRKVLPAVRESTKGRIITVFGCGGDRDRLKRPLMAKAVEELADIAIVTSDNPRSEDPLAIIKEVVSGFSEGVYHIEPDREKAILQAIRLANKDDSVLIAGKGHEKQQIFATAAYPFDDVETATRCCALIASSGEI